MMGSEPSPFARLARAVGAGLVGRYGVVAAMIVIIIALPLVLPSSFYLRIAALVFIFSLAVLGLNLLMGFAGQVSLGHAGFFGHRRLRRRPRPDLSCNTILGGCALAVATLGMGLLIAMVFTNETAITNGPNGMPVPRLELFGWRLSSPVTQAGFLESLAHGRQRERAGAHRAALVEALHQPHFRLRVEGGRGRHRLVGRIDAAAGKHEFARHELVACVALAEQHFRHASGAIDQDQGRRVLRTDHLV